MVSRSSAKRTPRRAVALSGISVTTGRNLMQETASTNVAAATPVNGQARHAGIASLFAPDRLREFIMALETPFDPAHIKWRVTNTVTTGSRNGPVLRGQMLAYADPRAYTDRLNSVFGPAGWTRDYRVQVVQ